MCNEVMHGCCRQAVCHRWLQRIGPSLHSGNVRPSNQLVEACRLHALQAQVIIIIMDISVEHDPWWERVMVMVVVVVLWNIFQIAAVGGVLE